MRFLCLIYSHLAVFQRLLSLLIIGSIVPYGILIIANQGMSIIHGIYKKDCHSRIGNILHKN